MNPQRAKQTERILNLSRVLDYSNRQAWRNNVIVNMECYIKYGYYDRALLRKIQKNRRKIISTFQSRFNYISESYELNSEDYDDYVNWMRPQIVNQLTYEELLMKNKSNL